MSTVQNCFEVLQNANKHIDNKKMKPLGSNCYLQRLNLAIRRKQNLGKGKTHTVILFEPISSQYGELSSRRRKRNRNHRAASDVNATESSCCFVESKGREVEETTNLIFDLENISEVFAWRNGTGSTIDSILP